MNISSGQVEFSASNYPLLDEVYRHGRSTGEIGPVDVMYEMGNGMVIGRCVAYIWPDSG